ncbi:hypothetical protein KR222_007628, partial [Zaprionus bogoriensis]
VRNYKVSVVGAGGGIGQPLSLLLKLNPLVSELSLHDVVPLKGVALDLSHICTNPQVGSFEGTDVAKLATALADSHVVVVPAGLPRKKGMTREQLLDANACVAKTVASAISIGCPKALVAIITNPINTLLPLTAEFLKSHNSFDPNRLFGVTTLDVVRARSLVAHNMGLDPKDLQVPVIGGHAGITILPLLSQCKPKFCGSVDEVMQLTHAIQEAGTDVLKAKDGKGSATLSMAYAAAHFVNALMRGLNDEPDVIECAYVASNATKASFFATPLLLGPDGIKKNLGLPEMDEMEKANLDKMLPELMTSIKNGVEYAKKAIAGDKAS